MNGFENVYTMTAYYDGPREGIADFCGKPHVYESTFDDLVDGYTDTFLLMPIDDDLFELATEDWKIWRRWERARLNGETPLSTHPALPEDRLRHDEIKALIGKGLKVAPELSQLAKAEFKRGRRIADSPTDVHEFYVKWKKIY